VLSVLFVFRANKIDQVGIGLEHLVYLDGPRLSVRLGIIYRDLDFQTPEVHPPEARRDFAGVRQRVGASVEPNPIPKAGGLNTKVSPSHFPIE